MDIKKRSSNLELLRIVAMLMIIAYHIYLHCVSIQLTDAGSIARMNNGLFAVPLFYKKLLPLALISSMGRTGNVIFMTLTGYLMVPKGDQIDLIKISKKLLLQLGFAAFLLVVGSTLVFRLLDGVYISMQDVSVFNSMCWYPGYYFLVILLAALVLNRYLGGLDRKQYTRFVLVMFSLTQLSWIIGLFNGLTGPLTVLNTGVFLYSLGGYIRKYNPFANIRVAAILAVMLAVYGLLLLSTYNGVENRIQNYVRSGSTDLFQQYIPGVADNHISAILLGVSLFELFRRIRLPGSRIINYIGASTFMIYLIHDNAFFYSLWDTQDWITLLSQSPLRYLGKHLVWTLATFAIGFLVYCGYQLLGRFVRSRQFRRLVLRQPSEE